MKSFLLLLIAILTVNLSSDEGRITKLNGIDLWWNSYGDQENPTALLIMGLNSNSKVWSDQYIESLVENNLHVVVFDNRDIGKSTWVTKEPGLITFIKYLPNFFIEYFVDFIFDFIFDEEGKFNMDNPAPAEYNLSDMAMDGVSLLDHLGISEAHIVGASMGGMIAQVMALENPNRVKSLTLFFTTPGFDTPGLSGPSESFKIAMKNSFLLNLSGKEEEALVVTERALTGKRFPFNENDFVKEAQIRLKQGINTSNAQIAAVGASPNRSKSLKDIDEVTLIIHGTEDPLIPVDHGLFLYQNIPNAKKLILEGVGHEIPNELLYEIIPAMLENFNI